MPNLLETTSLLKSNRQSGDFHHRGLTEKHRENLRESLCDLCASVVNLYLYALFPFANEIVVPPFSRHKFVSARTLSVNH